MAMSGSDTALVTPSQFEPVIVRSSPRSAWQSRYQTLAIGVDIVAGVMAGFTALQVRFGFQSSSTTHAMYSRLSLLLPLLWVGSLWLARAHERRFLGAGSEEWRRVAQAGMALTAAVGFTAFATRYDLARGYVVLALPLAVGTSMAGRYLLRRHLQRERADGRCLHRVVAVGHAPQVCELIRHTEREPFHGMTVVGVCVPGGQDRRHNFPDHVLALGDLSSVTTVVRTAEADTVAVTSCPELAGAALRRLAWDLELSGVALVVAPGLVEVEVARLHVRPVNGLSLLYVEHPTLSGGRRTLKAALDRLAAALLLVALSPVLLAIGLAIRLASPGPALYRQTRVGRDGKEFTLFKFRTMAVNADVRREELAAFNECGGPLFKMRHDPRITRTGAWLRRYSLDELPQLVNVLIGDMSLVGPRPPLPAEVQQYGNAVRRRLRVKPGLTGLWQVSGRSDLDWEETVRLDLRYVENWSIALDAVILWKTVSVVLRGRGAY